MQVRILNFRTEPESVFAVFTLDRAGRVSCTNPAVLEHLAEEGITVPSERPDALPRIVYPKDGRAFMDALPHHFTGMLRVQPPEA
ncbi:hypothetical protein ASA1KI_21140 [Opitutales bacterium ASA1]|uniref:hypothetical protein n=1 Tax=Congregicoccus parvus TaxID=3081749 RepID=UPI002B2830FC|nr:hypothetical protein ASA1KI_21140 [Opitutales bacterium ASA1]